MVKNRKKEKRRTGDRFRFCEWVGGRVELTNERPARVAIITLCQIGNGPGGEWARSGQSGTSHWGLHCSGSTTLGGQVEMEGCPQDVDRMRDTQLQAVSIVLCAKVEERRAQLSEASAD